MELKGIISMSEFYDLTEEIAELIDAKLSTDIDDLGNINDLVEEKGVIELTLEHVSRGAISLGDADRVVMTAEDARDLIETLQEAVEDAEGYQEELIAKHEEKELTTTS